jgi:hypothetical protein
MSSIKTYLFTDRESGQVLLAKKSRVYTYEFQLPGVDISVVEGLSEPSSMALSLRSSRFAVLRKKVEALIFLRTSECTLVDQIEKSLSVDAHLNEAVKPDYEKLIQEERTFALDRVKKFFSEKQSQIEACDSEEEIACLLKEMSERVNLGVYSAMNQERKGLDGQ